MSKGCNEPEIDRSIAQPPVAITTTIPISRSQPGAADDREGRAAAVQRALGSGHGRSAQPPTSRKAAQRRATREPRDHSGHPLTVDCASGCETARGRCAAHPVGPGTAPRPVRRARPSRLVGVRVGRSVSSQAAVASRHPACEAPRSQSHRASPEPEPAQRRRRRQGHPRNVAAAYKTHVHVSDVSYGRRRRRHNESPHAATRLLLRSCAAL